MLREQGESAPARRAAATASLETAGGAERARATELSRPSVLAAKGLDAGVRLAPLLVPVAAKALVALAWAVAVAEALDEEGQRAWPAAVAEAPLETGAAAERAQAATGGAGEATGMVGAVTATEMQVVAAQEVGAAAAAWVRVKAAAEVTWAVAVA